tara:strand:- start:1826 stop:2281 length:456 start_codon:yes stop_codon:yes gene_type:complete
MELSNEEYRAGYYNLLDIKEKQDKKIQMLEDKYEELMKNFSNKNKIHKEQFDQQQNAFNAAIDSLGGVEIDNYNDVPESVAYFEATKRMVDDFNKNTNGQWKRLVNNLYGICETAVRNNTKLGLSVKQKKVIDDWLEKKGQLSFKAHTWCF